MGGNSGRLAILACLAGVACSQAPIGLDAAMPMVTPDAGGSPDTGVAAVEPCAASDGDGDGFGTHASCARRDCDDRNAGIFPGAPEACNGLDDDCNDAVDDGLGSGTCGMGQCARVVPYCVAGRAAACTPGTPQAESCNDVDDDCNGQVDEGLEGPSCGQGACLRRSTCVRGTFSACTPGAPVDEACNGLDDDCDGETDEGFGAEVVQGTYTALRQQHAPCDGSGQRMGPDCNAAIHRSCAGTCRNSGFGPLENSGDVAIWACVRVEVVPVSYAALAQAHGPCNGSTERVGPNCNAAIHRTCVGRGRVSGFGPLESGPDQVSVGCLDAAAAEVVQTTYSVLVTHHDGCTRSSRYGPSCNAAINRFCASRGARTGFGPVENSGDDATVVCVRP